MSRSFRCFLCGEQLVFGEVPWRWMVIDNDDAKRVHRLRLCLGCMSNNPDAAWERLSRILKEEGRDIQQPA